MLFKKGKKFDEYVDEAYNSQDILLLDVRSKEEYNEGHLKGSQNIPLEKIMNISIDKDKSLYVYCYSGARSSMAVRQLKQMGYSNVTNIGGINKYKKDLQRG